MSQLNRRDESIRLLANGFSNQFAEEVAGDERFHDLLMEMADKFVENNIPIVAEDDKTDMAYELFMRVTTRVV
jgi:hypothetical protein